MTDRQELFFELFDAGNIVRLEPIESIKYDSSLDWDKNWVKTKVTAKSGTFSGQYIGNFMTVDFEKIKRDLSWLYDNLTGTISFNDLEGYLELHITGDGIGHFEVNVKACDQPGINGSELTFTLGIDQAELTGLVSQLDRITKQFPIVGTLK
jgi:hypothetical protein